MSEENKVIPVKVSLRCRPLIPKENAEGCQVCLQFTENEPQVLIGRNKAFTYDYVFNPTDSQGQVYDVSVKGLVDNIFKGFNATVLAYGQTGSGKTFTMGGAYEDSLMGDEFMMGIIPRVVRDLFEGIDNRTDYKYDVRVSYLELWVRRFGLDADTVVSICASKLRTYLYDGGVVVRPHHHMLQIYKEDLIDLLTMPAKKEGIQIREDINGEILLQGMQEVSVSSYNDTLCLLQRGSKCRSTGATAMNSTSSRSHAIFTIHIDQTNKEDQNDLCHVKFHLVDLAGSERAKRTKAEGERFKEGININKGLLALGNVISALGEEGDKRAHIPYRDSKLTRILQDSLGGNSHTVMVACVSPADSNLEETLNTLRYADRARKIKNKPIVNRDPQAAEILRLKQVVQQLRLQFIGGDGAVDGSGECALPSNNIKHQALSEELNRAQSKINELIEENEKLTTELQSSVDQATDLCERTIMLETNLDKLKARVAELQQQIGVDFESLSARMDCEASPQTKELLDIIKKLIDSILTVQVEEESKLELLDRSTEDKDDSDKDDNDKDQSCLPYTPQSKAVSTEYVLRQAEMGRELQQLNRLLDKKQELANQMSNNDSRMESMRQQYESTTKQLEGEISTLQTERETLLGELKDVKANANAHKLSEQRRVRLKDLEQQLSVLKKKLGEQGKVVKLKNQSDKQVSKLNTDIQGLKQTRVKLMKKMKEDAEQFRKWKQEKDKEVMQLMQKDRKRQCQIAKLQRVNDQQHTVLKRKAEEAAAANRRLKEALTKHADVMKERSKKLDKCDSSNIGNRVRQWLNRELEVRVRVREVKYHLNSLLTDRKTLTGELQHLEKTLLEGPAKKRMAWTGKGESFEMSMDVDDLEKNVQSVKQEIELRNAQITDLQEKILDAEQDRKEKDTYSNIHTMMEAKCALKYLLEEAVGAKADISTAKGDLNEVKENFQDVTVLQGKYDGEVKQIKQQYEQQITEIQRKYENKVLFLLSQLKSSDENRGNVSFEESIRKRLQFQEKEIERLSGLSEKLEAKKEECDHLRKQLTMAAYKDRRISYLPEITSPGGSPFIHLSQPQKEKKMANIKEDVTLKENWSESENEVDDGADDTGDPDWRLTPHVKRFKKAIQDNSDAANSTFCVEDTSTEINESKVKKGRKKRPVLASFQTSEMNSSDDFENSSTDDSKHTKGILDGGFKKKRKLLSRKTSSFFSPISDH